MEILGVALSASIVAMLLWHLRAHRRQDALLKAHVAEHKRMSESLDLVKRGVAHVLNIYGKGE